MKVLQKWRGIAREAPRVQSFVASAATLHRQLVPHAAPQAAQRRRLSVPLASEHFLQYYIVLYNMSIESIFNFQCVTT